MAGKLLRFLNGTITLAIVLVLLITGAYAGYSLWDNQQVYDAAENVVAELRDIRSSLDEQQNKTGLSMSELIAEYEEKLAAQASKTDATQETEVFQAAVSDHTENPPESMNIIANEDTGDFPNTVIAELTTGETTETIRSIEETVSDKTDWNTEQTGENDLQASVNGEIVQPAEIMNNEIMSVIVTAESKDIEETVAPESEPVVTHEMPNPVEIVSSSNAMILTETFEEQNPPEDHYIEAGRDTTQPVVEDYATVLPATLEQITAEKTEADQTLIKEPDSESIPTENIESVRTTDEDQNPEQIKTADTDVEQALVEEKETEQSKAVDTEFEEASKTITENETSTNENKETEKYLKATETTEAEQNETGTKTEKPVELTPFQKLQEINPDITAWITIPNTGIDYPILQGITNYSYINTDVYGDFALAGSIFLDSRNNREYQDKYSLVYGHDMSQHRMFSDLNLFKDEEFFRNNRLGMLLLSDGGHLIESLAIIVTSASDSGLFNPENWMNYSGEDILRVVQENNLYTNERGINAIKAIIDKGEMPRIVSLSTCSYEYTNARTILLTLLDPEIPTE